MNSKDTSNKLLTEQELLSEVDRIWHEYTIEAGIQHLIDLIQSQKLAHGEVVIGKNREYSDKDPKWYQKCCEYINKVKAKQRKRNV